VFEMTAPFTQGFLTSAGLIIAIGAQNAFVLSQGLTRRFNFLIAAICCITDALLIIAGVLGMGLLISENPTLLMGAALGGALFLTVYSLRALRSAFASESLKTSQRALPDMKTAIITTYAITLLNPHVYLDTLVLIGSIGGQYPGPQQNWFILGATLASGVWFFTLSIGAKQLGPVFESPKAWRTLDIIVCIVMGTIAYGLWRQFFNLLAA